MLHDIPESLKELNDLMRDAFPELSLVFGEGPGQPRILLCGEAPGEKEEAQHRPFVGAAGKNLNEFLHLASLDRADIYVTNVVKFRPTQPGARGVRNRKPTPGEITRFLPWLDQEIALAAPQMLVSLGNVPLSALSANPCLIGDVHGTVIASRSGLPLFCLYHPAAVIYRRELKAVYEQDVRTLSRILAGNM